MTPSQLLMSARPRSTVHQGSPNESIGDTVLVFLGALTLSTEALSKVGRLHVHLGVESTISYGKKNITNSK